MSRFIRRNGWVFGLFVLFGLLLVFTRAIQPDYGSAAFISLTLAVLPFAFAAAAQTPVVIAGGIDLSIASMMALTSVTAATLMDGASEEFAILVVPMVLLLGVLLGAINGALIVITRVPDIVVTLAMLFVWEGAALLVLNAPGGGAADWLKALLVGTFAVPGVPTAITDWIPTALVLLVVCLAVVWIPVVRSRLGLSIYAIGSDSLAAFRSGVSVSRTRIAAYALGGLFAAMGGLVLTMSTGIGAPIPGPYLLASVAAVVLGGVTLGGGQGGLVGPIVAVFILRLVRSDLTFLSVDPNAATIVEGTIMVIVVMLGALVALRSRST
ncbi:ABC transporter permease [Bauldia litoralis]|uniref:Autoinducer 2 import system permease protein LsrD n=1 Tax=Bauldia litoralis TaxID=665467 RepID=A0A1G6CS01_9HYPH|nr:ABC transporter permease [Bauldia litoralis]SDB35690.1 ribose transport system permease protein [Bauldia litoralis]